MESIRGNLEEVVRRLSSLKVRTQMPQIEGLVVFEGALYFPVVVRADVDIIS